MSYVAWIELGGGQELETTSWRSFTHVADSLRRDRVGALVDALGLRRRREIVGVHARRDRALLLSLPRDAMLACEAPDDLARALGCAAELGVRAQPHAWGGSRPFHRVAPVDGPELYALGGQRREPRHRLRVQLDGEVFVWTTSQDERDLRQVRVEPRRVPITRPALIPGASPRLRRYLGRHGARIVESLRSVAAVEDWIADEPGAAGWDVLVDVEREVGGLTLGPDWGLRAPDRFGPQLILRDRDSLAGLDHVEDEDREREGEPGDPAPSGPRPWPLLRFAGVELAIVGVHQPRIDSPWCVDRRGLVYELDVEFCALRPEASSVVGMLEKYALFCERYAFGTGVATGPALRVATCVAPELPEALGLAPVPEASDGQSASWTDARAWLVSRPAHPVLGASTVLYTHDAQLCVRAAELLRAHAPALDVEILGGVDDHARRRREAIERAGIERVVFKSS
jgi:hypothetical protein